MQFSGKKGRLASFLIGISPKTVTLLNIFLPFLLCAFVWFAFSYIKAVAEDPICADIIFRPISDNLFSSLLLVFCGAAAFDCSIANGDLKK